jgi:hypothetical protein
MESSIRIRKAVAAESITGRIDQIVSLIGEIGKDSAKQSEGALPEIAVMSDFHGQADTMFRYLSDRFSVDTGRRVLLDAMKFPKVSVKQQLEAQGVQVTDLKTTTFILGDFLDRGKFGLRCLLAGKELVDLGLAVAVTGNHDYMFFGNVMGLHLPIYQGYDYKDHLSSRTLVEQHWDDPEIAEDRHYWWNHKQVEYYEDIVKLNDAVLLVDGKEFPVKVIREELRLLFFKIEDYLSDEEDLHLRQLAGIAYTGKDYPRGFNALGEMSSAWWRKKVEWLRKRVMAARDAEIDYDIARWEPILKYVGAAHELVFDHVQKNMKQGKWWYKFFDDLDEWNMCSVEWAMSDWLFHWGKEIIAELNEVEGTDTWTMYNFMRNPTIKMLAEYWRARFSVFQQDAYGNVYTHGWLPVSDNGRVTFIYKGVKYSGKAVWDGLRELQRTVRDLGSSQRAIMEALTIVNTWYAEDTTRIKPEHLKRVVNFIGLESVYRRLGIRAWFTGHNPLNTLQPFDIPFMSYQNGYVCVQVDKGMSHKKYNDLGGYALVGSHGVTLRGFEDETMKEIVDNPATVKLQVDRDKGVSVSLRWENRPLDREHFLAMAKDQLIEELGDLKRQLNEQYIMSETVRHRAM